jgi:hypothetical protein
MMSGYNCKLYEGGQSPGALPLACGPTKIELAAELVKTMKQRDDAERLCIELWDDYGPEMPNYLDVALIKGMRKRQEPTP